MITANDPAEQELQHTVHTAATASPDWLLVRDRHIGHLMACRACYAPTGRYCVVGAELYQQYRDTEMEAIV
ncbi:hypothetical protein D3879_22715 [Pseudomonas cavernicola]|uniref:Uncharacterized protein n=1 Tax=Pseudomonas cavernicola TaxID=2320866 RepID=A0A418X9Z1_9PSED|nr:hypothetical protein D3879_22715 [Pseudomonas cavernicola]